MAAQRWMGPPGWEFAWCEIDLRAGGAHRFVSRAPIVGHARTILAGDLDEGGRA
jgi:uncharacterized protein YndB with AHSA1/START domain